MIDDHLERHLESSSPGSTRGSRCGAGQAVSWIWEPPGTVTDVSGTLSHMCPERCLPCPGTFCHRCLWATQAQETAGCKRSGGATVNDQPELLQTIRRSRVNDQVMPKC